jgi:hypothetical protein
MIKYVNAIVHTAKDLLTRPYGEDGHVCQAVDTLIVLCRECAIYDEAALRVIRVDEKVVFIEATDVDRW